LIFREKIRIDKLGAIRVQQKNLKNCARCIIAIYVLQDKHSQKKMYFCISTYILYRRPKKLRIEMYSLVNEVAFIKAKI